jgi:tripartite-type tricarboxylate transporter receptor subunit TctC
MSADHLARRTLLAALAAPALIRAAGAQEAFPTRAIRLVVPWPPGGGVDVLGRALQAALSAQLGQAVVIDNIGGGNGRLGSAAAARAPADGHTLLLANDTFAATEALPIAGTPALRGALAPVTLAITAPQGCSPIRGPACAASRTSPPLPAASPAG